MAHGPIRQEYAYDLDKNLTGLTVRSGEALLSHASYAYDGNGNRIRKQALDGTTLYQYDALNQLQRVDYPAYSEELFYDKAGNRARRLVGGEEELYQYDPRNRLMALTRGGVTTPFQYDNAGNLLRDDKARYSYDAFNRTVKVETFDGNVQVNRYDAEGLRHEMEENGRLVRFIFHKGEAVAEQEENSNVIRLIRGSELIARSGDSESARTYYHYASDEMGSTTHIVDENGNVKNRYAYDAWGKIEVKEEAVPNRFTYYGQQIDPITQQYYLRARFYNPVIGRFTQEDTYRGDGLNLYAYCANNPVYYVDPLGQYKDGLDAATRRNIRNYIDSIRKTETLDAVKQAIYDRVAHGETLAVEDIYGLAYLKYGQSPQGHNLLGVVIGKDASGNSNILFADAYTSGEHPFKLLDGATSAMNGKLLSELKLDSLISKENVVAVSSPNGWRHKTHTEPKFTSVASEVLDRADQLGYTDISYIMLGYQGPCQPACRPLLHKTAEQLGVYIEYTGILDESKWVFGSKG